MDTAPKQHTGWCRFTFREDDWSVEQAAQMRALDGYKCLPISSTYWLPKLDAHLQWAQFPGVHGLQLGSGENWAPVPISSLSPLDRTDPGDWQERLERRRQLIESLCNYEHEAHESRQSINLVSMRGHAGLILPDSDGLVYSWQCDGVSLSWRTLVGHYVPLSGEAAQQLHVWGDNIYTNDGALDTELIDGLLAKHLPGWRVDLERIEASCEAALWLRCERDVLIAPAHDPRDQQEQQEIDEAWQRAEWLASPFADETHSDQTALVSTSAMLVWGNSD
jgi:hypothetical protein